MRRGSDCRTLAATRAPRRDGRLHRSGGVSLPRSARELSRHGRWMAAVLSCGQGPPSATKAPARCWPSGHEQRRIEVSVLSPCELPAAAGSSSIGVRSWMSRHREAYPSPPPFAPCRPGYAATGRPARAGGQPGGQAGSDRSRGATGGARSAAARDRVPLSCGGRSTGTPSRSRTPCWSDASCRLPRRRAPPPADRATRKRVQGGLLLARPGIGRGDRQPALPPHTGTAGARPPARPGARCRRHDGAPVHARAGDRRARPRRGSSPTLARRCARLS